MQQNVPNDEMIRRYLLNELSDEERQQIETRLMTDDEFFQQVLLAEDELIEQYANGALSESERKRFEHSFLCTPEGRQQVSFTTALKKYASDAAAADSRASSAASLDAETVETESIETKGLETVPQKRSLFDLLRFASPAIKFSVATAMLLVVLASAWLIATLLEREQDRLGAGSLQGQVSRVVIRPGLTRGGGNLEVVSITSAISAIQLQLDLREDDYKYYQATLQAIGGEAILTRGAMLSETLGQSKAVLFDIPASSLSDGDYMIKLSGITDENALEEVDKYYFRVVKN